MKLPYGYVLIDGTITVHEEKADIVRYSGRAKLTFKCREFAATPSRKR